MPLFDFQCRKCGAVTEVLSLGGGSESHVVTCAECGSDNTAKLISAVSFKVARRAKYSDEFLHHARGFLQTQKQTAQCFADSKGSEDSRTFQLAERIGERIDRTLASQLPVHKR
jgi:putative FmdB family regulatory protein